jgi:hypothetical protein
MFLLGAICAARRLRMGMQWGHTSVPTVDIMRAAELCVSNTTARVECPNVMYYTAQLLHLPGAGLPHSWAPPAADRMPFGEHWLEMLDAERLVADLLEARDGARLAESRVELGGDSTETILLDAAGAGTIRLITLDAPAPAAGMGARAPACDAACAAASRRRTLHSDAVRLRAWWDGGVSADGGWPAGEVRRRCAEVRQARPSLDVPLSALWGPPSLHSKALPLHPMLLVGETARYGLHIALPMPFWRSACVMLAHNASAEGSAGGAAGPGDSGDRALLFDVRVVWANGAEYGEGGQAGYFFAPLRTAALGEGTFSPNVVVDVRRLSGSLVGMVHTAAADSRHFVEGDILIRVDGCPTPAVWSPGYEDWFLGSHAYHCGHFVGLHHAYTVGYDGQRVRMWQARVLTADAVPFRSSLEVSLEGGDWEHFSRPVIQCLALVYGWPAPPLALTDAFTPGDELGAAAPPHGYEIVAEDGGLEEFALASHVAGFGLGRSLHGQGDRLPAETFLVRQRALALRRAARVTFRVAVAATNEGVILRRLSDLRRPAGVAEVRVDGVVAAGGWLASDRSRLAARRLGPCCTRPASDSLRHDTGAPLALYSLGLSVQAATQQTGRHAVGQPRSIGALYGAVCHPSQPRMHRTACVTR